ncbi:hypothetical protein PHMEG_00035644 [Phytophthora megakarya]|uniref:Uncharacterized protein n=1 Tax=Phytophthora megakarya TaxID=4795 RepID=A0A225UNA8_9STRA|nr:hypothetical protein PHMEG_00035644 [Phytophthora megakarya]
MYSVDETAIQLDMPPHKILGIKGRKGSAKVQGPKKHTGRMTAVFTIRADATEIYVLGNNFQFFLSYGRKGCAWLRRRRVLLGPTITKNYFGLSAARWAHRSGKRLRAIKATIIPIRWYTSEACLKKVQDKLAKATELVTDVKYWAKLDTALSLLSPINKALAQFENDDSFVFDCVS